MSLTVRTNRLTSATAAFRATVSAAAASTVALILKSVPMVLSVSARRSWASASMLPASAATSRTSATMRLAVSSMRRRAPSTRRSCSTCPVAPSDTCSMERVTSPTAAASWVLMAVRSSADSEMPSAACAAPAPMRDSESLVRFMAVARICSSPGSVSSVRAVRSPSDMRPACAASRSSGPVMERSTAHTTSRPMTSAASSSAARISRHVEASASSARCAPATRAPLTSASLVSADSICASMARAVSVCASASPARPSMARRRAAT